MCKIISEEEEEEKNCSREEPGASDEFSHCNAASTRTGTKEKKRADWRASKRIMWPCRVYVCVYLSFFFSFLCLVLSLLLLLCEKQFSPPLASLKSKKERKQQQQQQHQL